MDATTYHCVDGTPAKDINNCIFATAGTKMTVDAGLKYCIGAAANGNINSYTVSRSTGQSAEAALSADAKCLKFRCLF